MNNFSTVCSFYRYKELKDLAKSRSIALAKFAPLLFKRLIGELKTKNELLLLCFDYAFYRNKKIEENYVKSLINSFVSKKILDVDVALVTLRDVERNRSLKESHKDKYLVY
jgi:replication initiation and membrane attachment protein DnaB